MLRDFFKDKEFLRQFGLIALPVAGQNFINFATSMADTLMIGQLGEVQLAAVNQANQLGFILNLLIFGLGSGSNVMIAQYWGKRDVESIRKVMTLMYRLLIGVVILFTCLAVFFPHQVMSIFSNSPQVIESGTVFLRIVGLSYFFNCFATATIIVLRSVGIVRISLVVYTSSLFINIFLNWVLIFGKLGFPALGVKGGAIATVLARLSELIIVLIFLFRYEKNIGYRLKMFLEKKNGMLRDYFQHASPVIINELLWGMGTAAITAIIGWMSTEFNAAYTVCSVLAQLLSVAFNGAGSATAVIIGNTVGAGQYQLARQRANKLLFIGIALGVGTSILVLVLRQPILSLYNMSPLTMTYAYQIMGIVAFMSPFSAISMVTIVGVLRGGGDSRFAAYADVVPLWVITIPLGYLAGHVWGWTVPLVYVMLRSDVVIKAFMTLPRIFAGGWVKDVTRVLE
ncbi:MAG: MATE family efflux transporter [Oscillospiraceae bacterium]